MTFDDFQNALAAEFPRVVWSTHAVSAEPSYYYTATNGKVLVTACNEDADIAGGPWSVSDGTISYKGRTLRFAAQCYRASADTISKAASSLTA